MGATAIFRPNPGGQKRLIGDTHGPMGVYMTRLGNQMVNRAKIRANVDTGLMRSRIEFRLAVTSVGLTGQLVARTNYARYVHDGTRYTTGNPFLTDAVRDVLNA